MGKKVPFVLICLLVSTILGACGPSQAERDEQATKIVADISATRTAEAPTLTPILTLTPTPMLTLTPTPVPPTPTPIPTTGTIIGVLIDQATGEPVTDISLKPFAQEKVIVDGVDTGLWREVLPDYEEVSTDQQGAFTLSNVPHGTYSIRATIGEATAHGSTVPVWAFLKDSEDNVIRVQVIVGQTIDFGQVLVATED